MPPLSSLLYVGVQISSTSLSITSDDLQEGVSGQDVTFDFSMVSVANTGSVSGSNLWQLLAFGSQNSDGSGTQNSPITVSLSFAQGSVGVTPGATSTIQDLDITLDLSGSLDCEDIPYICVTLDKGTNPSPDFSLSGVPDDSVFTACQAVTCLGIQLFLINVPFVTKFLSSLFEMFVHDSYRLEIQGCLIQLYMF